MVFDVKSHVIEDPNAEVRKILQSVKTKSYTYVKR
jgi:hypothetical protein